MKINEIKNKVYEFMMGFVCSSLAIITVFTEKIFEKVGITEFLAKDKDGISFSVVKSIVKAIFLITFIIPMLTLTSLLNWDLYKKFMRTRNMQRINKRL